VYRKSIAFEPIDPQITAIAKKHGLNPETILEIFQSLQEQKGELTKETILDVARAFRIPAERAYGVASFYTMLTTPHKTIRVCDGPACWLRGSAYTRAAIESEFSQSTQNGDGNWSITRSSCLGLCDRAPAILVGEEQCGPVDVQTVTKIASGWRGSPRLYNLPFPGERRVLLAHAGEINPDSIESAISFGAYQALEKVLNSKPVALIDEIESSGLRGRGGAGFPTGRKLRFVSQAPGKMKYIVCNADESEPLVFKDRVMIDTNPHKILEGMALAAYAVGAQEGFIYIRGEYKSQAERLEAAVLQAEQYNLLGDHIRNSGFSFKVHVHRGAGAYICGEETALLESLEGKRGEPRIRPPFPATYGYHGYPTVVNNVETFATIPEILANGADWYTSIKPKSNSKNVDSVTPGTKLYTILGHVNRPGLFEAPYGLTLRRIISDFGGGMAPGSEFHFALTGGAAGTIVSSELLDIPIDYGSAAKGVSIGAGAFLICDQTVSPIILLREVMHFFESESCGKCNPCRIGTHQVRLILDRMIAGKGNSEDKTRLLNLADMLQNASFCGLGQSAAIPIRSSIEHFEGEFEV
jgi:NADP-reducing hydrogenase subunit HndC